MKDEYNSINERNLGATKEKGDQLDRSYPKCFARST